MKGKIYFVTLLFISTIGVKGQAILAGQILPYYFNVNPDTMLSYTGALQTSSSMSYFFDVNGNGQMDLELNAYSSNGFGSGSDFVRISTLNSNSFVLFGWLDSVYNNFLQSWMIDKVPKPLHAGDSINTNQAVWGSSYQYLTDNSRCCGTTMNDTDWVSPNDLYLGIRYIDVADTIYGWIRVNCPVTNQCYIRDFSFSKYFVGVNQMSEPRYLVYPNPVSDYCYIKSVPSDLNFSTISITNLYGKEVKCGLELIGNDLKISFPASVTNGCYFVRFASNNSTFVLKIIKEHQ